MVRIVVRQVVDSRMLKEGQDFKELAAGVKHFKETEEGRGIMCESVEKYGDKRAAIVAEKTAIDIFLGMIKEGIPRETAQKIAKLSDELVDKAMKKVAKTV